MPDRKKDLTNFLDLICKKCVGAAANYFTVNTNGLTYSQSLKTTFYPRYSQNLNNGLVGYSNG